MVIKFTCPSCGKRLKVAEEMAGKRGRCPYCQNTLTVPLLALPPEAEEKIEIEETEAEVKPVKEEIPEGLHRCPGCGILVEKSAQSCPRCGTDLLTGQKPTEAATLARPTPEKAKVPPATFWAALPYAPTYPFNLKGLFILILGAVLLYIVNIIQSVLMAAFLLGLVAQIIVLVFTIGYVGSYMFRIIAGTAGGEQVPPSLPSLADYVEDIIIPFWQFLATFLVSFAPLILYWVFCMVLHIPIQRVILLVLFIYALFCLPMGLIAVAMFGSASALNPVLVMGSILKVPLHYLGALVFIGLILVVQSFGTKTGLPHVPVLSGLLSRFVSLYFLMVDMRVLGLIYRYNEEKLHWY